jgi:thiamine pyrophosphokinase
MEERKTIPPRDRRREFLLHTVIVANGTLSNPQSARRKIEGAVRVIAANGGAQHCRDLQVVPDLVVGDLDSLTPEMVEALRASGARIERHPSHKDETDLEIAVRRALEDGAQQVIVLGAMGARWDQSIANLLLLAHPDHAADIRLIDHRHELSIVRGGETRQLQGTPGDTVSLLPLAGDAAGIRTKGLEYPLKGDTLHFGSTRGVSNVLQNAEASVSLEHGLLACVIIRQSPTE